MLSRVAFSPNGTRLAATNDGASLKVWDMATGRDLAYLPSVVGASYPRGGGALTGVAFSPDGTQIALGGANGVEIWDATTYKLIRTPEGYSDGATRVVFSPDGTRLASASVHGTVIIGDPMTGKPVPPIRRPHE